MQHPGFLLSCGLALSACSLTSLDGPNPGLDASNPFNTDGGVVLPVDGAPPPKPTAFVRLAQLAPPLGAVDFCLRANEATYFVGPFFFTPPQNDAGDAGGPPPAALYPGASRYVQVPATGATEVAIVAAGQGNCQSPKLSGMVTIDPNKRLTIAVMGATKELDAGVRSMSIASFVDDTQSKADEARVRVIHGALGTESTSGLGELSVSLGYANTVVEVAAQVNPRQASTPSASPPKVSALGYHDLAPVPSQASLRFTGVKPQGGPWSTAPADLALTANAVRTVFLVSTTSGFSALICSDLPSGGDAPCSLHAVK